ncbi:MAG: hypothetical protein OFPII_06250 [Osedax symbiont Rs1]|nr:MAG: hypothetical protein OFPII_06250 [Osedax symbiont Rs1]
MHAVCVLYELFWLQTKASAHKLHTPQAHSEDLELIQKNQKWQ